MTRFHERTLALLDGGGDDDDARPPRPVGTLMRWAERNAVTVPAAYLEWAALDDGSLLGKYSNDDSFWFDEPEILVTPEGVRGLLFNRENQGNFDRVVVLDGSDDPPVLFAEIGKPPWVTNAERFSDAVFAQVFDWQYLLEFESGYKEIAHTGDVSLKTDGCLARLRHRYPETVSTRFVWERIGYTEYRFVESPTLRLTVTVADNRATDIRITGRPAEAVKALEAELKDEFAAERTA